MIIIPIAIELFMLFSMNLLRSSIRALFGRWKNASRNSDVMIASTASCVNARSTARKNTNSSDRENPMTLNMMIDTILDEVTRMVMSAARMISMIATSGMVIAETVSQSKVISVLIMVMTASTANPAKI